MSLYDVCINDVDCIECTDMSPLVIQPEPIPPNGSVLLSFKDCPTVIPIQPLAITASRHWPVNITHVTSSCWWDLLWTLYSPYTHYHIRSVP